jgi:hypothetical protein
VCCATFNAEEKSPASEFTVKVVYRTRASQLHILQLLRLENSLRKDLLSIPEFFDGMEYHHLGYNAACASASEKSH